MMKLSDICRISGATLDRGDANLEVSSVSGLDSAVAGQLSFLGSPRYTHHLKTTGASAVIVNEKETVDRADIAVLRAKDPYLAFAKILSTFFPDRKANPGIHPSAVVDETSQVDTSAEIMAKSVIGRNCVIGPGVIIHPNVTLYDGVKIGANTVLHSGVSVREGCEIGERCIIHNNVTIGADGFGFAREENKKWFKIPQTGRVVIEDDVDIGANSTVDSASLGETRIKRGVKIDNLVQIGHSCIVGDDSLICAQTGLAGSTEVGDRVIIAGQVGLAGHMKVGDDVVITAKSGLSHDVEPGKVMSGIPAFENRDWLRSTAAFRRLGDMARAVRELEKRMSSDKESR